MYCCAGFVGHRRHGAATCVPVCDFLRGGLCSRSLRPSASLGDCPTNDRPVRLLCCLFFVIGAISGAQPGRWELPGAAGLAGRPGAPGSAPGLPQRPLRRQDGRFNCICVHLHDCSFNELYVFLIVFQDKKCTYFPLHAYNFTYECMGLMCVKVSRHV